MNAAEPAKDETNVTRVKIGEKWLSTLELDQRATEYVLKKDKNFKRDGVKMSIWIDPTSTEKAVQVFYGNGIGKMGWRVLFSQKGDVTEYTANIMGG